MDARAGRAALRRGRRGRATPGDRGRVAGGGLPDPEASAAGARLAGALELETDERRWSQPEVVGLGVVCAAASIFFGIYPSPLLDLANDAGTVFTNLF